MGRDGTAAARERVERLYETGTLPREELLALLGEREAASALLFERARERQREHFGNRVYLRGLIEFTSCCRNDCYYCGLRRSNRDCERYHLTAEQILDCCARGYALGLRTFVLQGGEDPRDTDVWVCALVRRIREAFPDCAVTLSIGEKSRESYRAFREAGADRYLLRHETADPAHYRQLHPEAMSWENRMRCLRDLRALGFQTGAGMMVGSPFQTAEHLVTDLLFLRELAPEMIGIGPFIPHARTPFRDQPAGSVELTVFLLGILRLMHPRALLPATTALGTLDPLGREKGLLAGANVIMPNLSPADVRGKYLLYDGKLCTGEEAAESRDRLAERLLAIGYEVAVSRGDAPGFDPAAG